MWHHKHLVLIRMRKIGTTYVFRRYGTKAMQDPGCDFPRIPIPRTPVNKGKRKGLDY